ncbi:hypothetical protein MC7420_7713 [Coleofasciculus chthonoplastes PCC 7420]|uniref:Uncharacterized protein n=1 Tax=Coleofasciculus chthonoplastes PCC 7420 TaxID=118168 RepID=B4VIV7_9CYAN|nr:hypothetical protein MC7420_7713 [Coleofasciculus chthonoplastes PCC 7420]
MGSSCAIALSVIGQDICRGDPPYKINITHPSILSGRPASSISNYLTRRTLRPGRVETS